MTCKAFLPINGFKFQVHKLPGFEEYVQGVTFPGVVMGETGGFKTPFQTIALPGEHMTFEPISARFKVNYDMSNYTEIFDWIRGLGKPTSYAERKALLDPQVQATLSILDSSLNPTIQYTFYDLYPDKLSGFTLALDADDIQYVEATVQFNYTNYDYNTL